ncbi:MAG: saccharopine dehydrogenase NADP-binding domain-containing protein, partial [Anaerolineae bacterium]|nr:saccharopine dehydrogenase NADP-binding domain-containing protein [Anaerolineae bacterium]
MKVLLLGSTGMFGKSASKRLVGEDLVTEIGCASRRPEAARRAAESIGSKGHPVCVDISDTQALAHIAAGCDIIINTAGPTSEVQTPAVQAAITAGV